MTEKLSSKQEEYIKLKLSETFEHLLQRFGDTPEIRLAIANYTLGYVGASYGLHIK